MVYSNSGVLAIRAEDMSLYDAKNLKFVIRAIELTSEELATNCFLAENSYNTQLLEIANRSDLFQDPLKGLVTSIKDYGSNYLDAKNLNLYNDASNIIEPLYKLIHQWVDSATMTYSKSKESIEAKVNIYINKIAKTEKLTKGVWIGYASTVVVMGLFVFANLFQIKNLENKINTNKLRLNDLAKQETVLQQQYDKITHLLPTVDRKVKLPPKTGLPGLWQKIIGEPEYEIVQNIDPKAITPSIKQQLDTIKEQLQTVSKDRIELNNDLTFERQKKELESKNLSFILLITLSGLGAYYFLPRNGYLYQGNYLKIKL